MTIYQGASLLVFTNSDEYLLLVFVEPLNGPYFILGRFWLTEDISDRFPSSFGGETPLVAWSQDAQLGFGNKLRITTESCVIR